ncbi:hypothetical protein [Glycomyces buryatensis]|uniref:ATP-grasp domain-containing protein n=1 Tax=Glycomyces buryatensis TaxID=2570927 RepID=A0A4S8Q3A9_9ACTN|nr:hypothetical protein [Glycomyces buryatensis]THV37621.1 hypothetical protein FAB82_20300 [Glycomyces buryatensis]
MGEHLAVLCLGSGRQTRELAAAGAGIGFTVDCAHVREDERDWQPRDVEAVHADALQAIRELSRPPDAVVNFGRATVPDGIRRIAEVMERLRDSGAVPAHTRLVGPPSRAAKVWGDKALIARSMRELDLPIASTVRVATDETGNGAPGIAFPFVVKVVDLTGGSGMRYVEDATAFDEAVRHLAKLERPLIACEFLAGDEVSVDLLRLGTETLVYPPGFKRATDRMLTHADHKIKVNGAVREVPAFTSDVLRIAEAFDLQGFFSLEAVVTSVDPLEWRILEGATRVTNNIHMQDASLGIDSFAAVLRYVAGLEWRPADERLGLALSIPVYRHLGRRSVDALAPLDWVRQVKVDDLSEMPDSSDSRHRLTVKMAVEDLDRQLAVLAEATGDDALAGRVRSEIARVEDVYGGR